MKIFSGSAGKVLGSRVCSWLNEGAHLSPKDVVSPGKLQIDKFSDGEMLPLFNETIRDEDVFFVQTTKTSDSIIETLLVIDAAKRAGCRSFTLVAPYIAYSRQDKTDHLRSSIGSKVMADILEKAGMSRIITIDLHASAIQGFYNVPVIHLNGNKIFIDHIKQHNIDDLTILAPDQGAVKRASDFCKAFPEATFAMINKKRVKPNEVHSMELVGDVAGRNVVIVDDMADTLGTLKKASELVMEKGAKSVRGIATHGILSGKAYENLMSSPLTELLVSDSIEPNLETKPSKLTIVSCDRLIYRAINSLMTKRSIHEMNSI
jgi:ribose-phosphate pyrophosphokinase